jgi:hypothetical protein
VKIELVQPFDNIHWQSFLPQANALVESTQGLADDKTLLLCAHLLGGKRQIPDDYIIYNCEQIGEGQGYGGDPSYLALLKKHEVWDYSHLNIAALGRLGIKAKYCGVGYSPNMTKPNIINADPASQDIDVLFYGSINERRKEFLMELNDKCVLKCAFGVYGAQLDGLIARAKIVLNLHCYPSAIHEITRTSYLMANKKFVVSEYGKEESLELPYYGAVQFCKYENLVTSTLGFLEDSKELRQYSANLAHRAFVAQSQRKMVVEALKQEV